MAKQAVEKRLKTLPPVDHALMAGHELYKALLKAGKWGHEQIADALGMNAGNSSKSWASGRAIPDQYLVRIEGFVRANASTDEIADQWWPALEAAWERDRRARSRKQKGQGALLHPDVDGLVAALRRRILADRQLTRLPALFETGVTLPLATAYVELRIAPARPIAPMPQTLETRPTLTERIRRRTEERLAARRPPQEALDNAGARCRLVLGAPGSGKSSLLRRLALDIAAGTWKTAAVPLFVEARAFAERRRGEPSLSLFDYACRRAAGAELDPTAVLGLLTRADVDPTRRAILLVDGLDEIASDREAVAAVYGALADSASGAHWIAAARPTGLVRALDEDQRFEMADLDRVAVAALVDNWCKASTAMGLPLDPTTLRRELDRIPGMREMSANPFLLTALCFLKSTAPGDSLPNSRIAVYERLLDRIADQARARHGDPSILSAGALGDLAGFACFLYRSPHGAIQIFREAEWREFAAARPGTVETDFARQIVPSRLLAVWHEDDPQYHFLHLTLQEHLVARAMLDWPVTEALAYRFKPAWRSVFRFYGALLWARRRTQAFATLTAVLFETRDVNDLSLITLAEIFADAGLRDTTRQLGVDLRVELLRAVKADHAEGMAAFIDALALLDPAWLAEETLENGDRLIDVGRETIRLSAGEEHYPGHLEIQFGRDGGSPYVRLATSRTPRALATIEKAFWHGNPTRQLMAAHAYADVATPAQRDRVVRAANRAGPEIATSLRFYAFALSSRSGEFLPFLERLTSQLAERGDDPFSEALSLVAVIGGSRARAILRKRLHYELRRHRKNNHQIELCARAVARLGGEDAIAVLDEAAEQAPNHRWREYLEITRQSITPDGGAWLVERLRDFGAVEVVLRALADAATFGLLPGADVLEVVRAHAAEEAMCDGFDLAILERQMLEAGAPPALCGPLVGIATGMLAALVAATPGSLERDAMTRTLSEIVDVLGLGRWAGARPLVETIMDDPELPVAVVASAITAAGRILEATGDAAMLGRLEEILYDERRDLDAYEVTLAIGRIDLERLFRRRGALTAGSALQEIAAETDCLVFEESFVDRDGQVTRWRDPPRKVLCAVATSRQGIAGAVAHELSRFGLHLTSDWPADCSAGLVIFEPLEEAARPVTATEIQMLAGEGGRIWRLPHDADVGAARRLARRIGHALAPGITPAGQPRRRRRPRRRG